MLTLEHSESNGNNFKTNSVANLYPMQIRKYGRFVENFEAFVRQLGQEYSGHAEGDIRSETDMPARRDLQKSSREPTIAKSYGYISLSSQRSTNVTKGANHGKKKPCMFRTPDLIRRTFLSQGKHPDSESDGWSPPTWTILKNLDQLFQSTPLK